MIRNRCLAILVMLAAAGGCGQEFKPYSLLSRLRVLAVGSEPAAPAAGETATLSALVFTERGAPEVTYAWSWCPLPGPAGEGYPCRVTEEQTIGFAGSASTVPPFDLGTAATARFPHMLDPSRLAALCEGVMGIPPVADCEGGFPIQVMLRVTSDTDELTAVQKLRLRFDPAHGPNANPRIGALVAEVDGMDRPLAGAPPPMVPDDRATIVRAAVADTESEPYTGARDGLPEAMNERLTLSWFVDVGYVDSERTGYIPGVVPLEQATRNEWVLPRTENDPGAEGRIFVVLRDNRGGVSWTEGTVVLGSVP